MPGPQVENSNAVASESLSGVAADHFVYNENLCFVSGVFVALKGDGAVPARKWSRELPLKRGIPRRFAHQNKNVRRKNSITDSKMTRLTPAKATETSFVPAEAMVSCCELLLAKLGSRKSMFCSCSFRRSHPRNESHFAPAGVTSVDRADITHLEPGANIAQVQKQIKIIVVVPIWS